VLVAFISAAIFNALAIDAIRFAKHAVTYLAIAIAFIAITILR
jgi:hypothetical protein